jgi:hypothetical protein
LHQAGGARKEGGNVMESKEIMQAIKANHEEMEALLEKAEKQIADLEESYKQLRNDKRI